MSAYTFPEDLYVRIEKICTGPSNGKVKAEIYRRIESKEKELVHMKRVGLVWLDKFNLEELVYRISNEHTWNTHG